MPSIAGCGDHRADGYTTVITTDQADELVEEYADAEHRRERREIENRVLAETVWQVPENQRDLDGDFVSKHYEIDRIRQKLPDDAIEANRLLKKHRTEDRWPVASAALSTLSTVGKNRVLNTEGRPCLDGEARLV